MFSAQGLAVDWAMGGEKNCIPYSLFCILIIIIITIISSISSISFVALLNCIISTQEFSLLSMSPPHPAVGEGEGE